MNMKIFLLPLIIFLMFSINLQADTFGKVVTLLNQTCAFSSCHSAETKVAGLDLSGDRASIYEAIVNQSAQNPVAEEKKYSLVVPGEPSKSFLYRKINNNLHRDSKLTEGENQTMPVNNKLANEDIELVRQWILFGANNNEVEYVKYETLKEYYADPLAHLPQIEALPVPAPEEGYQVQLGPIFLAPGDEVEYVYRYELRNQKEEEVNRIDVEMNSESHHLLLFNFIEGYENAQAPGLLKVDDSYESSGNAITSDTKMLGGWVFSNDFSLPEGTAYKWQENEVLKLNYHILNYSSTGILPAKLYINIYTQPVGTAIKEMHSEFHLHGSEETFPDGVYFPPGVSEHQWHMTDFENAESSEEVHIWNVSSHTHKYGVDFDMYLYEDGGKGEQVYEGFYNFDYTVNQGFYDFSEPPFKLFDNFLTVLKEDGLWIEGKYENTSDEDVFVGLTTKDEMFGMFVHYLTGDISDVRDLQPVVNINEIEKTIDWSLHPNPAKVGIVELTVPSDMNKTTLKVFNILGNEVLNRQLSLNQNNLRLDLSNQPKGYYFVELNNTEGSSVRKLLID